MEDFLIKHLRLMHWLRRECASPAITQPRQFAAHQGQGLLTGCYPNRIGLHGALFPSSVIALNNDEETIAELLKQKGYATGMAGKWHLGQKEPFLPLQNGFDEYFGLPYSNDMWPVDFDGKPCERTAQ
jgi:arylsulfatase